MCVLEKARIFGSMHCLTGRDVRNCHCFYWKSTTMENKMFKCYLFNDKFKESIFKKFQEKFKPNDSSV